MRVLLVSFLLVGILVILSGGVIYAIGNPSSVSIGDVYVFRDLLETGDQLYFMRYDVDYSSTPSEDADDTWQMALYDSSGALVATRPLNYYQHNIISIYLTPTQAITWGDSHQVKVMGMPSVFSNLTEGVNMRTRTLGSGDYYEKEDLGGIMLTQAGILEADWGITLLSGGMLNSTGAYYFNRAVPNLSTMVPEIFGTTTAGITPEWESYNLTYLQQLQTRRGVRLDYAVMDISNLLHTSFEWTSFWLVSIAFLLVAATVFASTGNPGWAIICAFPVLVLAAWTGLGVGVLTFAITIVLVVAFVFGLFFILGRFPG